MNKVPWIVAAAAATCIVTGAVLDRTLGDSARDALLEDISLLTIFASFPFFGALVLSRGARLGWVFLAFGVLGGVGFVGQTYAHIGLDLYPGRLPGAVWGAWIEQWWWYPAIALIICYLPLLFPDGRLPSRRWRAFVWVLNLSIALIVFMGMFKETITGHRMSIDNPVGFVPVDNLENALGPVFLLVAACSFLAVFSLFLRYRRASSDQRQQIKWFMFAITFAVLMMVLGDYLDLPEVLFPFTLFAMMGGIAISVLKYRLYDIDVVINRALVYGALTATLLASYLGAVFVLSRVLDPITRDSDIAVAASTLAVAALFRPLRARIQGFIDQRFYRAKYDAARAVATFAARLRDEIEVDAVRSDVLVVVGETLQPRHASLWLTSREGEPA